MNGRSGNGRVQLCPSSLVFRMAQSSRSASSSTSLSDDPMEKLGDWFQSNSRPIGMAVGGVAVAALAIFGYRSYSASQNAKASTALYAAQALFDQKKYAEGVASLDKAMGGASADFSAAMESMIAVGYELQGKLADAATHYGKASAAAKFENDKKSYKASEARSLMAAGKNAEARKIWEELATSDSPSAQEANVRLGELAGAGKN